MVNLDHLLEQRGYELNEKSNAGKLLQQLENDDISDKVFEIISRYQSARFIFNYVMKHSSFNSSTSLTQLSQALIEEIGGGNSISGTFLEEAKCHCGGTRKKYAWELEDKDCPNCGQKLSEWKESKRVQRHHVERLIGLMQEHGILESKITARCISCSNNKDVNPSPEKDMGELYCENCSQLMRVEYFYGFPQGPLRTLEGQGYWLEWYVKRLLSREFGNVHEIKNSRMFSKADSERKQEIDVVSAIESGKVATFSCYDTHSKAEADKVNEILKYRDFSDIAVFVTTGRINQSNCEHIIESFSEGRVLPVNGHQLEDIGSLIRELLTKDFKKHLEQEDSEKVASYLYLYNYSYPEEDRRKMRSSVIKRIGEDGLLSVLSLISDVDYPKYGEFAHDLAESVNNDKIRDNSIDLSKGLHAGRWEKAVLSLVFLTEIYSELDDKNKGIFVNKLESSSHHRSLYVRKEVANSIEKIYEYSSDDLKDMLREIVTSLCKDHPYVEARARDVRENIGMKKTESIFED